MDSGSLPAASSPKAMDDTEVLSQRTLTAQGEAQEALAMAPEDNTYSTGHMGEQIPMETGDGCHFQIGPLPNTIPETYMAPESGRQPPSKQEVRQFHR